LRTSARPRMGGRKCLEAVRQSDWKRPIGPRRTARLCWSFYGECDAIASSRARICLAMVRRSPVRRPIHDASFRSSVNTTETARPRAEQLRRIYTPRLTTTAAPTKLQHGFRDVLANSFNHSRRFDGHCRHNCAAFGTETRASHLLASAVT
jgi:hypothetical protein